jgi:hypothetical protein
MGNHQFIEQSSDIDGFFGQELQELFAVSLTTASLTAHVPTGYTCDVVGGIPSHRDDATLRIDIGSMVSLEQRNVYLRIMPLSLTARGPQELQLTFAGVDSAQQVQSVASVVGWTLTDSADAAKYPVNTDVEQEATLIDLAHTRAEANRLNQEGRYGEAGDYVRQRQQRSAVYATYAFYENSAADFERPIDAYMSKKRIAREHMSTRFSTKDLAELKKHLADLIRDGASQAEIDTAQSMVDIMTRLILGPHHS